MNHHYTYQNTLAASEKVGWRVDDIIGGDNQLDFNKPFLPEALAQVESLTFLTPDERLVLNQIRGYGYLHMFGVVEEFILPFVLDHARPQLRQDEYRTRALLQFASEEAKHMQLFKRFREKFENGFGTPCAVIGPSKAIAEKVLSHSPLAVAVTTLQLEWMSQAHYLDSVKNNQELDPLFKSLLKHHWMEEAQHARLDTLMVESLAEGLSQETIGSAVEEFLEIGGFVDNGLTQQVQFDIENLESATGRTLTNDERDAFTKTQLKALRYTFLGSGMTHANFLMTLEGISPAARARVQSIAPLFC